MTREVKHGHFIIPLSVGAADHSEKDLAKNRFVIGKYILPCCNDVTVYLLDNMPWEKRPCYSLFIDYKDKESDIYELSISAIKKIRCVYHDLPLERSKNQGIVRRLWMHKEGYIPDDE